MMPQAPALSAAVSILYHTMARNGGAYMTPRLMPLASMIFSRWGMRRDHIKSHGKMAKKKSQQLDHTGLLVNTRKAGRGGRDASHLPGPRSWAASGSSRSPRSGRGPRPSSSGWSGSTA